MVVALIVVPFASGPASAEHDEVPVFVIGQDGGLSPFVLRRDSEEFRDVVFPPIAEALARVGIRAVGEEPFRARFNVDGIEGDFWSRWSCPDFVHFAPQVPVDDAGNKALYVVCVDVWIRTCREDATVACTQGGADVHESGSQESIFAAGFGEQIPIPSDYNGDGLLPLWIARSEEILRPLGAKLADLFSEHLAKGTSRGGSSDSETVDARIPKGPTMAPSGSATTASFRDCAECPALVAIEPGSFLMGRQENTHCRDENAPVVEVKIARPFAAGVFEVTVDEWAACLRAGGCSHDPPEWNPGRANRPVTDVSWDDALQYVRWLSARTGRRYRLLSEAEWLYLASERRDGLNWYPLRGLSPSPNRFGLHGLVGSVMEWLDDPGSRCFTDPPDPGRWNDHLRILRGPSQCHHPRSHHRARRDHEFHEVRDECYGFRVARQLGE